VKRVLVIVVVFNGRPWLDRCLGSVTAAPAAADGPESGTPPTLDVYVVDNDSTDGSADYIQSHFPGVKLVRAAENLGFSKANNLGMQYALDHGYDYVYLLNQDAWLEPGAMEKLVAAAESHPEFAVLSPLQMTDGYVALDKQFKKVREGVLFRNLCHPRQHKREGPTKWEGSQSDDSGRVHPSGPEEVKRVMAAHWLVSVKALKEVGLFNEDLFPFYGQDDNWCHRARHKGYKIGIVPEARAVHDRAERKEDKDRIIFRNYYTGSLVRLANPNVPMWLSYIYILAFTVVKAVKYRSLKVFTYFFRLHSKCQAVRSLRKA
jgi:GT2 family glycosyltransferase